MAFLTVEDYLGSYEVIAFSSVYGLFQELLAVDAILGFEGKVNVNEGREAKLLLDRAYTLDQALAQWPKQVHFHLSAEFKPADLRGLETELRLHPGQQEVFFHLADQSGRPVMVKAKGIKVETGAWLADFLRENRERFSCRFTARPQKAFGPRGGANGSGEANGRGAWGR